MMVALGTDEVLPLHHAIRDALIDRGHDVVNVGPLADDRAQHTMQWADVGRAVGERVASGVCTTAVLCCWTGTGASIAANKVAGVRAALCTDRATAEGARRWNDANVLVLSNRLTTPALAAEMIDAWFATDPDASEADQIARLER